MRDQFKLVLIYETDGASFDIYGTNLHQLIVQGQRMIREAGAVSFEIWDRKTNELVEAGPK